ncbi:MAG: ATP-dependent DNA helicase RecG [Clostridia bacterium]|nr:ATP-dependent DNA helicase RecG [Clostridia bacterium]
MKLDSPVSMLKGIGKTRAEKLAKIGIQTVRDLIYHYPRAYEDRGRTALLGDHETGSARSYFLTVSSAVSTVRIKNRITVSKFKAFDDSGSVEVIFFNSPYVKDIFHVGGVFRFYGRTSFSKTNRLNLVNPKYEPVIEGKPLVDLVPLYPTTEGINSKLIDKLVLDAISDCIGEIKDHLPDRIRLDNELCTLQYAIKSIHSPDSAEDLRRAQRRLAFDELFTFALGVSYLARGRARTEGVRFAPTSIASFTALLPYELTASQKNAINDIYRDTVLREENGVHPAMARILIGDVGCGKTVCAAAAIYFAFRSGYQSALMAPTEILAIQHYNDLGDLLGKLGARVALLTGSTTAAKKRRIYESLANGDIDVIIGTHALLTDKVSFASLGLIVTDEQHRFGVAQRATLKDKTANAHMLVMSATPIPRTLALAMYGDLDISRITDMPKGRSRIDTFVVDEGYRTRLNSFIAKQVSEGGQCYVICPSIEKEEDDDELLLPGGINAGLYSTGSLELKNAVEHTDELRNKLPKLRIACLHGRMKNSEKDEIMSAFGCGEIDVLVSTTVIEVGVNVPNASLMIVENAERFGLSQLHQLRGRVGRGKRKSYCVLVSDLKTEKVRGRLETMRTVYDGFEIASKDLAMRGPGDFFSMNSSNNMRQSGGFEFKLAPLCDDAGMLEKAFGAAKELISEDPELSAEEHLPLRSIVESVTSNSSTIS